MPPMGRPPKILDEALVDQVIAMIELGVYPTHAAQANGISEGTLANWKMQGEEWEDAEPEEYPDEETEKIVAYVDFLRRLIRAEARGIAWHEVNVRAAARDRNRDGRLSLDFLSRRRPKVYSRTDRLDVSIGGREPAPVSDRNLEQARKDFLAVDAPEDMDPATILPQLPAGE